MACRMYRPWLVQLVTALIVAWWGDGDGVAVAQAPQPTVKSDQDKPGVMAGYTWLSGTATSALVLEPPPLRGVSRWAIESPRHRGEIYVMAVSPDGARAATGGADGVIRIWNLETGGLEKALIAHRHHIYKLRWSPDGRLIASHAWGGRRTKIWEIDTGKQLVELKATPEHVTALAFSPDSRQLAAGGYGSGKIFVSKGVADYELVTELGTTIEQLEWFPDGERLVALLAGGTGSVREASGGRRLFELDHPTEERPVAIIFSPDGKQIATASAQAVTIWQADGGALVRRIAAKQPFTDVAWSPDGGRVLAATALGSEFYTTADGKPAGTHPARGQIEWAAKTDRIVSLAPTRLDVWSPDGKNVVSIDAAGTIAPIFQAGKPIITGVGKPVLTTWNPKTLERTHRLEGHGTTVTVAVWSKDGKNFASGGANGSVILWDVDTGKQLHALSGHTAAVTQLAWSPRSDVLASAGGDKSVRLWKEDGSVGPVMEGHAAGVTGLAWSPSGKQLVSSDAKGVLIVWDAASGKQEKSFGGTKGIACVDWASIMNTPAIACGMANGGIRVFDASKGEEVAVVSAEEIWSRPVTSIAWMPGPKPRLLTGRTYLTEIWDVAQGDAIARQIVPGGATTVSSAAGGTLAVARAADRTVRFWEPAGGTLRGTLLEEGDVLAAVLTTGDVTFHKDSPPNLIGVVETEVGQQTVSLDDLKKKFGWRNNGKMLKLPTKN